MVLDICGQGAFVIFQLLLKMCKKGKCLSPTSTAPSHLFHKLPIRFSQGQDNAQGQEPDPRCFYSSWSIVQEQTGTDNNNKVMALKMSLTEKFLILPILQSQGEFLKT